MVHVKPELAVPPLAPEEVYVGNGILHCQYFVPSMWCNPFVDASPGTDGLHLFRSYVHHRMDVLQWLTPLTGRILVCTCLLGDHCHAHVLADTVETLVLPQLDDPPPLCGPEEDTEECEDLPGPVSQQVLEAVNETLRTASRSRGSFSRKPSWPVEWHLLLARIRLATSLLFWEVFAGVAVLTGQFRHCGWEVAPPIDTVIDISHDVFHPEFLLLLLGIIFEHRIGYLHLGVPCSSFSMAFNRFLSLAIRTAEHPGGIPGLPPEKQSLVDTGNALVHIAITLAEAQQSVGHLWGWEQPGNSLQLLYQPLLTFVAKSTVFWALSHICAYGAIWIKPTMVFSNSRLIEALCRRCPGCDYHQPIAGRAPCGTPWSQLASAYFPMWARSYALIFRHLAHQPFTAASDRRLGWCAPCDISPANVLRKAGFQPSAHRHIDTVARRICAMCQPSGRAAPQLIADGLQPETHLQVALRTTHPYLRPLDIPDHFSVAFARQAAATDLAAQRATMLKLVTQLARTLQQEEVLAAQRIDPLIAPVVARRSTCLMREVQYLTLTSDASFVVDYCLGKPMLGFTRRAASQRPKLTVPEVSVPEFLSGAETRNARLLCRVRPSGDDVLDEACDTKMAEEHAIDAIIGPFPSLEAIAGDCQAAIVVRHPIWEAHGGAEEPSCRVIDDMLTAEHNGTAGAEYTHVPADVDGVTAQTRMTQLEWPTAKLAGFTSDFRKAYKQDPASPQQLLWVIIAVWSHFAQMTHFWLQRTQLFGSRVAPLNFSRISLWMLLVMASTFAVPMTCCVDDVICIERASSISSAYLCWRIMCDLAGWDVPNSKSPLPSLFFRALGVFIDLRLLPKRPFYIRITQDRLEKLINSIDKILEARTLLPGAASQLWGQLCWTTITTHGKVGKPMLRALNRRAHEKRHHLNPQLRFILLWWRDFLSNAIPRSIAVTGTWTKHVVSYSDGEGSAKGGVGVALWLDPEAAPLAGFIQVPHSVRRLWRQQREHVWRDIFELEAVAPLLILATWGHLMQNCVWTHYIDNEAALAALIRGSASVTSGDVIVGATWRRISQWQISPWFDRVMSASNPVDGLSRGREDGPWHSIAPLEVPSDVLEMLDKFLSFDQSHS